jgi:hypothetical protein
MNRSKSGGFEGSTKCWSEGKVVVADLMKIFIASVSMFPNEGETEKVAVEVRRPLVLGTIGLESWAVLEGWSDEHSRSGAASGTAAHIPLPSVATCSVIEDPSVMLTISRGLGLVPSNMSHGQMRGHPTPENTG